MDKSNGPGDLSNRKKESMLANANFKTAMINQPGNAHALTNQQVKSLSSQNSNAHQRTKSQSKSQRKPCLNLNLDLLFIQILNQGALYLN